MTCKDSPVSDVDLLLIRRQLKNETIALAGIAQRCEHGNPQIVYLKPEPGNKHYYTALSNPLWLTCPFLHEQIHDLESNGFIQKISNFIAENRTYKSSMEKAHAHYYFLRKNIYLNFLKKIDKRDSAIVSYGIGGTREQDYIKCLHTHYAHNRVCRDNVIGEMIRCLLDHNNSCKKGMCSYASAKQQ